MTSGDSVFAVALTGEGAVASVHSSGEVVRWSDATVTEVRTTSVPVHAPVALRVSGPRTRIVWYEDGWLRLETLSVGSAAGDARWLAAPAVAHALALTPSAARAVVACHDGQVYAVDAVTGHVAWTTRIDGPGAGLTAIAAGTDVVVVTSENGIVRIFDVLAAHWRTVGVGDPAVAVAITPDATALFTVTADGAISRWHLDTGRTEPILAVDAAVTALAVDAAADHVVVGTADGSLRVHRLSDGVATTTQILRRATASRSDSAVDAPVADAPNGARLDEDVRFTVYRPRSLVPDRWASMLVFAHKTDLVVDPSGGPLDPTEEVEARANAAFGTQPTHTVAADSRLPLAPGTRLRIVPDLPGITCNPAAVDLNWFEAVHESRFRLLAGPHLAGHHVRGTVRVWCGPLITAELTLTLAVKASSAPPETNSAEGLTRYRKIFPSYAHADREIVTHFAEAARALGDAFLQDVLALRAGEKWETRLLELIEEADVFQLFWSRNSMRSPHCRAEWDHALGLGRPQFIRPLYWEEPLPEDPALGLPPAALRTVHFVRVPWAGPVAGVVCRSCGRRNAPDADFCSSCGSFLEFTGAAVPPPTSTHEQPPPVAPSSQPPLSQPPPVGAPRAASRGSSQSWRTVVLLVGAASLAVILILFAWLTGR